MADVPEPGEPPQAFTTTRLLDGKLLVRQPRAGHRAGTDAVLLAAAAPTGPAQMLVDVGAGVGTVGLAVALRDSDAIVHLVEKVEGLAALARGNAALNGTAARVHIHRLDIFDRQACTPLAGRMSLALSNPPFYLREQHRVSPDARKAAAHVLDPVAAGAGLHGAWLRAMLHLVAPHGTAVIIHRPEALPSLLAAAEGRLGAVTVRPIYALEGRPATRILFGGIVGSRAPLRIETPLILHRADGGFSAVGEALHRGELTIPLL